MKFREVFGNRLNKLKESINTQKYKDALEKVASLEEKIAIYKKVGKEEGFDSVGSIEMKKYILNKYKDSVEDLNKIF